MFKRLLILCLISLFSFAGIEDAKANEELPDTLQEISAENATRIEALSSIGGILQGQLRWSPDNNSPCCRDIRRNSGL